MQTLGCVCDSLISDHFYRPRTKVIFILGNVCPHFRGRGVPSSGRWGGGYPFFLTGGYPHPSQQGVPPSFQTGRYPILPNEGTPILSNGRYPHCRSGWRATPIPSHDWGGYPYPRSGQGVPHPRSGQGVPHPRSGFGATPIQSHEGVPLSQVRTGGTPIPHQDREVPPSQVPPHIGQVPGQEGGGTPNWNSTALTCYVAGGGGMPLTFTQEDFLVEIAVCTHNLTDNFQIAG